MLLASVSPDAWGPTESGAVPTWGFVQGLAVILLTYLIIVCQNAICASLGRRTAPLQILVNIELVASLAMFQFFFGGGRFLQTVPVLGPTLTLPSLFLLGSYGFGLLLYFITSTRRPSPWAYASQQLRLLLPFALPFLLFCLLADAASWLPSYPSLQPQSQWGQFLLLALFALLFMAFVMLILPPMIIRVWQCQPLEDADLSARLGALCKRVGFTHGGILTWTVMRDSITAAIVGVFPRYRYVLFTPGMMRKLSPSGLDAVLAHEIGHSYHRHLWLYPLILFGAVALLGLFEVYVAPDISREWGAYPIVLFLLEAAILLGYLRFVFGYFSRLFERQADLFVFIAGVPPQDMIAALDAVAIHAGYIHDVPSWHHHSVQQRMQFLDRASRDASVIQAHHRRVRRAVIGYAAVVVAAFVWLFSM